MELDLSNLQGLNEIQGFILKSNAPFSNSILREIGLLCFEIIDNSMRHGGSKRVNLSFKENTFYITDYSLNPYNPFDIKAGIIPRGGTNYVQSFIKAHPDIKLDYSSDSNTSSNITSIFLPSRFTQSEDYLPCNIVIEEMLLSRYNNDLEEKIRHIGHCDTIVVNFEYATLPFSTAYVALETIIRATSAKKQRVIIRMVPNDPTRKILQQELSRLKAYPHQSMDASLIELQ